MRKLLTSTVLFMMTSSSFAQTINILVLNGKTGKPVSNEHLLVLRNEKFEALDGSHDIPSLKTDENGRLAIAVDLTQIKSIELSVDWHRSCTESRPSFSMTAVAATGVVSENTCKPKLTRVEPAPGLMVLYVRDETFVEKMAH